MLLPGWVDFDKKINSCVLTVFDALVSIIAVRGIVLWKMLF